MKVCDLCDGRDFEAIADRDRQGNPLATVVCRGCGLVSHADVPSEEELERYYSDRYRAEYQGDVTPSPRRIVRAWEVAQHRFSQVSAALHAGDRIFEVGAGIGCNLKVFELAGYDATGIEPAAGFQEFSRSKLRAKVSRASLFDVPPVPQYDFVLLLHVIEHFRSPRAALEHIRQMLRPGGRLLIECPSLCCRHADRSQLFHFAHIHNFTWSTLVSLAERCGLQLDRRLEVPESPTLRGTFVKVDSCRSVEAVGGYDETMRVLRTFHQPAYRLKTGYWRVRAAKISGYVHEWTVSRRLVREILERCERHETDANAAVVRAG